MDKNGYDESDFENEFGFDFGDLGEEETDESFDYSAYAGEPQTSGDPEAYDLEDLENSGEFDLSDYDLDSLLYDEEQPADNCEQEPEQPSPDDDNWQHMMEEPEEPQEEAAYDETVYDETAAAAYCDAPEMDFFNEYSDEELYETEEPQGDVDVPDFAKRQNYETGSEAFADEGEAYDDQSYEDQPYEGEDAHGYEETLDYPDEEPPAKKKGIPVNLKAIKLPDFSKVLPKKTASRKPKEKTKPSLWDKFLELYLGPIAHRDQEPQEEFVTDPRTGHTRRRRKRTKVQIFKEVYLPPLILLVALLMIFSFIIGSVTNAFKQKKIQDDMAKLQAQQESAAADAAKSQYETAMEEADALAANFDFDGAIQVMEELLSTYPDYQQDIIAKKSEYMNTKASMVEWMDLSTIPNLSFHVLIADPVRAFANTQYGGLFNKNFVTTDEFSRILNELYANNYILVDFNSLVERNSGLDGTTSFFSAHLFLPEGKKPVMITETLVNYFKYMIDGNDDGEADAGGAGFASKLVVDAAGNIKAEYVDANGQTQVGDYDLVPILESFIAEHPDFSYRGARATLAVTGDEGIFGYRVNTSYIGKKGQAYYDQQVAEAKVVVDALKEKGYTLSSFTYGNVNYKTSTVPQIQADVTNWKNQVETIMGPTDVLVFARETDLDDYTGNKFQTLQNNGFRFYISNGESPRLEIKETYIRQSRLMVSGNAMVWHKSRFDTYFDCNKVLDMATRGNVPN